MRSISKPSEASVGQRRLWRRVTNAAEATEEGNPLSGVSASSEGPDGDAATRSKAQGVRLTVMNGPDEGSVLECSRARIRVGSGEGNDLRIRSSDVSRRHVVLRPLRDGIRLVDLSSEGGTFLGQVRVHDVVISGGAEVTFGSTRVQVELITRSGDEARPPTVRYRRSAGAALPCADSLPSGYEIRTDLPFHDAKEIWNEHFERTYLSGLLSANSGNVAASARDAGIDRRHLQRLMVKLDLRAEAEGGAFDRTSIAAHRPAR